MAVTQRRYDVASDEEVDGYQVPLHRSLTERPTIAGAPSEAVMLVVLGTVVLSYGLLTLWVIPFGFAAYLALIAICREDPDFLRVFKRYLAQKNRFRS